MVVNRKPLYQSIIQKLPFKRDAAARTLGLLLGRKVKAMVNHASMRLDLKEAIQRLMFLGQYEPVQTEWFRQCLRPGDVVIDIGASFGHYTTLAAELVGSNGKVFAFEPSPVANSTIEDTIKTSSLKNVILTKAAVGKECGTVDLYIPTTRHLHSPSILKNDPSFIPIKVPVVVLDDFEPLKDIPRIKLIKIDVEGYEPDVLTGMETLIKSGRIANIICEFNSGWLKHNQTTPQQLLNHFLSLGCQIHRQTELQENLKGHHDEHYTLQDIWFSI
jgi:FkbM family methyltransferase